MNARRFNGSNCISSPSQGLRAAYRIGEDRVSSLLRCEISTPPRAATGHSRHSRYPGVSGSPRKQTFVRVAARGLTRVGDLEHVALRWPQPMVPAASQCRRDAPRLVARELVHHFAPAVLVLEIDV